MIRFKRAAVTALGVLAVSGCNAADKAPAEAAAGSVVVTADAAAEEQSVRAINTAWFKSHNSGDVEGIVGLYADDAVVSAPGAAAVRGTALIREMFTKELKAIADGGLSESAGPNPEVAVSGDLAYEWNTYTLTDKSGKTIDIGKYTTIYARRNGKWMIVRDIWNSDAPPAPAA